MSVDVPQTVAPSVAMAGVQPSLAELVALRALAGRGGGARRAHRGARMQAPAPARGHGMEYAESRDYVAGDDARHIDWRVTARTGRPHSKTFQTERERLTLLVADTARVLYFGTRVRFKSVQAARAGAIAVWSAVAEGDRVAALRGSSAEAPVPPASGHRGALRVLHALTRWYAQPPVSDDGLEVALDHARRLAHPGARVWVLADAGSIVDIASRHWLALSAHSEVRVLLLSDPFEHAPPHARVALSGSSGRLDLDLGSSEARRHWDARFTGTVMRAADLLGAAGVHAATLSCDAPSDGWQPVAGRLVRG